MHRLVDVLRETEVDAIIIANSGFIDPTFYYVTGALSGGLFEGSYAVVTEDAVKILTSPLEEESAKKTGLEVLLFSTKEEWKEVMARAVGKGERIGLNYSALTVSTLKKIEEALGEREWVDVSEKLLERRMVKDEEEIKALREAARIASEVAETIPDFVVEGMRETELAARIVYEMLRNGAQDEAFTTIVAFGENAAEAHYLPGRRRLKSGDFILCDFGARYMRYNSDITRTYVFGRASERQRRMYDVVLEAQRLALREIRAGVNGRDVDIKVREFIDSTEFRDKFIHSLGHGIGLSVHDHIGFTRNYDLIIKEGMTLTVEPGVYEVGFGGVRIEDDVVVRKDGVEVITRATKDLIEI